MKFFCSSHWFLLRKKSNPKKSYKLLENSTTSKKFWLDKFLYLLFQNALQSEKALHQSRKERSFFRTLFPKKETTLQISLHKQYLCFPGWNCTVWISQYFWNEPHFLSPHHLSSFWCCISHSRLWTDRSLLVLHLLQQSTLLLSKFSRILSKFHLLSTAVSWELFLPANHTPKHFWNDRNSTSHLTPLFCWVTKKEPHFHFRILCKV